jgi:hypothetical protein
MGMEISPICDRFSISRVAVQTNFIDYLAAPLFSLLAATFHPVRNGPGGSRPNRQGLEAPLAQLRRNRALYTLCSDLDLEGARDWGVPDSRVAPSSLCAESQQLFSGEERASSDP